MWLWVGDDHPVIVEAGPAKIFRDDLLEDNQVRVITETKLAIQMCSDVNSAPNGDFIDIGPECFANKDALVICYKGENYYRACGRLVKGRLDGEATTCVKRVNHKNDCEDYDGDTRGKLENPGVIVE